MATDDKDPVDQALDLFVYAPIGLAYEAKDLLPKLAKRGKAQADLLRVAGEFAIKNSQGDVESFLKAAFTAAGFGGEREDGDAAEAAAELPIEDYDDLIASDIVKRLDGLDRQERQAIRVHETAGRGRVTILNKLDRLDAADE